MQPQNPLNQRHLNICPSVFRNGDPIISISELAGLIPESKMMKKDRGRFSLLCDMGDLAALLVESSDIRSFLEDTVGMISRYMGADACSIYLYEDNTKELVLKATIGLNPGLNSKKVGRIRLRSGEGPVGKTYETLWPIREGRAQLNPNSKPAQVAEGKVFESFLAVPVMRGVRKFGVLVIQHEQQDHFTEIDVVVLRALSSQFASAIENARLWADLHKMGARPARSSDREASQSLRFVRGDSASEGYAFAPATRFRRSHGELLTDDGVDRDDVFSLADFYRAVQQTSDQLLDFQKRLTDQLLESASLIFDAHFMMLKDTQFINKIVGQIMDGMSPPKAVREVAGHYIDMFSSSSNAYIREKVTDMEDLAGRILKNLYKWSPEEKGFREDRIVIAQDLYPSEILKLASEDVKGIILVRGGVTSHVSILARSLKIPLVIADQPELLNLPEGTPVFLDADIGHVHIRPEKSVAHQFETLKKAQKPPALMKNAVSPLTRTKDGVRVHLLSNINLLSELSIARDFKAEGIGLYRTEFPFLIRPKFPSEEEQHLIYKRLFDELPDQEVTIRTLDIGGDKVPACPNSAIREDLEVGIRSIRFCLRHRDIFDQQLRAILRAAADAGGFRIMFPMISSLDEFCEAKDAVNDCIRSLEEEGLAHHSDPVIGMMVELPSVLGIIREFAREADFFSIGTNDFVQYMLAVDRSNEKMADYYRPYHPSVLRGLQDIVRAAKEEQKDVSVCGEMAHEPEYLPFLLGIGVRRISVDPKFLPSLQEMISHMRIADAEDHARRLLSESTLRGAREVLRRGRLEV